MLRVWYVSYHCFGYEYHHGPFPKAATEQGMYAAWEHTITFAR